MIDKHLRWITLDPDITQLGNIYIKYNTIQAQDSYYQFNEPDKYHFYDVDLTLISMQQIKSIAERLYSDSFYISPFQTDYTRKVSSIFDILGYIGGIFGIFTPICSMILAPYAEFNFILKLLKKLFLVKTK